MVANKPMWTLVSELLLVFVLGGQVATPARGADGTSSLKLILEQVSERYCEADEELAILQTELRLQFTNTGAEQVLLWKGSGQIQYVFVAQTREDALAKRYLRRLSPMTVTTTLDLDLKLGPRPTESFVALKPGQTWETGGEPSIFVARVESNIYGLKPGKYLVQVEVETWPETEEVGKLLADRWKKWGDLWTRPVVVSTPLPIEIRKEPKVKYCP